MVGFRLGAYLQNYTMALLLLSCVPATINGAIGLLAESLMSGILFAMILMLHILLLTSIYVNFSESAVARLRSLVVSKV